MKVAKLAFSLGIVFLASQLIWASDAENTCSETSVVTVPSRPTVSNSTDTTQCGVVEVEYGWDQVHDAGFRQNDGSGGLRLGLTHNFDLHWSSTEFFQLSQAGRQNKGFGDNWLGAKYRFSGQTRHVPSFGIFYQVKIPTAPALLGSEHIDHAFSFLGSKDVRRVHVDFNVTPLLAGWRSGLNHNVGLTLSSSVPITRKLALVTEGYGYTTLDRDHPAYSSTLAGFTWQTNQRLLLDTGVDLGVSRDAPQRRVYAGVTYAVGNAFSWLRAAQ